MCSARKLPRKARIKIAGFSVEISSQRLLWGSLPKGVGEEKGKGWGGERERGERKTLFYLRAPTLSVASLLRPLSKAKSLTIPLNSQKPPGAAIQSQTPTSFKSLFTLPFAYFFFLLYFLHTRQVPSLYTKKKMNYVTAKCWNFSQNFIPLRELFAIIFLFSSPPPLFQESMFLGLLVFLELEIDLIFRLLYIFVLVSILSLKIKNRLKRT